MRASFYEGSRTFRTGPVGRPSRGSGQALLRVRRAGICGTDLHIFQGHLDHRIPKGGIIGLTKTLALELGPFGITVNAIAPGYIDTDMVSAVPANVLEKIVAKIPVGRLGRAEEIARGVLFLVADEGGFITGSTLSINGGQHMY